MAYENANEWFAMIKAALEPPMPGGLVKVPVQWQLAQGLIAFVDAIEADMQDICKRLQRLE